jgi:hypothetical protein
VIYPPCARKDFKVAHKPIDYLERVIADDMKFIGPARDLVAMRPSGFIKELNAAETLTEILAKMNAYWDEPEKNRTPGSTEYLEEPNTGYLSTSRPFSPNPESELLPLPNFL